MTMILAGDRATAIARMMPKNPRFIRRELEDANWGTPQANEQNYLLWTERNREHMVWIDPHPKWDPKDLKPHPGRHIIFDGEPTAAWKKWAKAHGVEIISATPPTDAQKITGLVNGKFGPRFTKEAAEALVSSYRGDVNALFYPVQALKLMRAPEPITLEYAAKVCWDGNAILSANQINRALGTPRALSLARMVEKKNAYGGLKYFEVACRNQPTRLEFLQELFQRIEHRLCTPWMALQLFVHLCYQEKQCQLRSKDDPSSSRMMPVLYRISGIPSSPRTW